MEYIRNTLDFQVNEPSVITFGKFDGLHRGHELLMENLLKQRKKNGYRSIVFTFDIPPKKNVQNVDAKVLTTNDEKHYIFEKTGVDYLIECPFVKEIMCMEPEDFIQWVVEKLNVKCIVAGEDFRFGHERRGDYRFLQNHAKEYGYQAIIIKKIQEDGRDISSTYIREEVQKANIEKANRLLGYHFFVKSFIIHGNQIGRSIGIPTINMQLPSEKLLPPNGVYVTKVKIDGYWYQSVSNVGCKPTINGKNPIGVETYIIDFDQNVYDKEAVVEFLHYIRPEMKFSSLDELKAQMRDDISFTKKYYKDVTKIC